MDASDVTSASRQAGDHPALETAARVGYAVNGVLHVIIGVIALALAFGSKGASADQSGALGALAENPFGVIVLWIAVLGWLGLAHLAGDGGDHRGLRDERPRQGRGQGRALPRAVVDGLHLRQGQRLLEQEADDRLHGQRSWRSRPGRSSSGRSASPSSASAPTTSSRATSRSSSRTSRATPDQWITKAGRAGYIAKGIALGIVGGLFIVAAVRAQAERGQGPRRRPAQPARRAVRRAAPRRRGARAHRLRRLLLRPQPARRRLTPTTDR